MNFREEINPEMDPDFHPGDSNTIEFIARISRNDQNDRNNFSDHLKLLDYIRNRFLPICNSSRRYKFQIWFNPIWFNKNSSTSVIASILEMDEIKHCSNVEIGIIYGEQKILPVEEISNWLELSADVAKNSLQSQRERFLEIYCYDPHHYIDHGYPISIQNAREMLEQLAKVYFLHFMALQIITYIFNFNFQIFSITINIYNCCGSNWSNCSVKYKNLFLIY